MDKYVVSRELAEKLRIAKYPQANSQFKYLSYRDDPINGTLVFMPHVSGEVIFTNGRYIAAPLSDELLEQLTEVRNGLSLFYVHSYMKWEALFSGKSFEYDYDGGDHFKAQCDKPADALAELWLWCREDRNEKD